MTISYNWLNSYLPEPVDPEKLSKILTAIGLEVESMEKTETIKGGLKGVVIGEVVTCEKHPDADKLKVTTVKTGPQDLLQIVCGAANVAAGQKVVVATVGSTIYPLGGEPLTMKKAKIRGIESFGMICAEDEIGLSENHEGIIVLPNELVAGTPAADYYKPETDIIYEIGLTPNRMDAMSHLGVARDVCAYLIHHDKKQAAVRNPLQSNAFKIDDPAGMQIAVSIEAPQACERYSGVCITGIQVAPSPDWLQNRLKAIGLRPINNIVDATNFILHETGQPLHAFDANKIEGGHIRVKMLEEGTTFVSLDEKERKLSSEDLMICDGNNTPLCIGGVFGGLHSGVSSTTVNVFLESAWFNPVSIRKSSFRHDLRTDAATRFEKGVDISQTVAVLKRAAMLIKELAGGTITGAVVDIYPNPRQKVELALKYHYLKKLSGKNYHPDAVRKILGALGFEFIKEGADDLWFAVPHHKPDITLQADLVEEIMRIDGLDNVEIPATIAMSPSADLLGPAEAWQQKVSDYLAGLGYQEIFTNSITNSSYYPEEVLAGSVKMMNNLSADLDIMRPSLLETGLECIAHNLNRRNRSLRLFEVGNTYHTTGTGQYSQHRQLILLASGPVQEKSWRQMPIEADLYYLKGVADNILQLMHAGNLTTKPLQTSDISGLSYTTPEGKNICLLGKVSAGRLKTFDIKQPVLVATFDWELLVQQALAHRIVYKEIPRYPRVERDLALLVDKSVTWQAMLDLSKKANLKQLESITLFDVFESDKLGAGKKSMALNFVFQDTEKTMTDADIDKAMQKLTRLFETDLQAAIRK
ncbi:MAG: phenylalanine--tRNA ligase subunit beta [Chitinophagaceae bacterium]|nr:phenylalanine--tRNA ligase subunit beta [Chitinophagaceae bacterium]